MEESKRKMKVCYCCNTETELFTMLPSKCLSREHFMDVCGECAAKCALEPCPICEKERK